MWRLYNMLQNNQWTKEKIKREIKKYLETNENRITFAAIHGLQQK